MADPSKRHRGRIVLVIVVVIALLLAPVAVVFAECGANPDTNSASFCGWFTSGETGLLAPRQLGR